MKIFVVRVTGYIPYPITREYTEKASTWSAAVSRAGYIPYPITREYTEKASTWSAAVSRAIKKYRKDQRVRKRRCRRIGIQVIKGGAEFI